MQLKVDMLLDVIGQRIAVAFLRTVIGELGQIVGLEFNAVDLVVAAESVDDGLRLVGRQRILAVLIGSELFEKLLLGEFLVPFLFRTEALRDGEERHDGSVVDTVDLYLIENLLRVAQRLGHIAEDIVHLLLCLEPLLLGIEHTGGIIKILSGGQTEQVVVGLSGVFVLEVAVVGAYKLDAFFLCDLHQHGIGALLQGEGIAVGTDVRVFDLMALQLEIIVIAEDPVIPSGCFLSALDVALENLGRHLAGNTRRADDQILVVFLQVIAVGTRPVIVSVGPGTADELDEILISVVVLCQDDEVIARLVAGLLVLVLLVMVRYIHLTAKDRLERLQSVGLALLVDTGTIVRELLDAIHHAVVGNGHALHAVLDGFIDQVRHLGLTVKYRIMSMYVQMNEIFHQFFSLKVKKLIMCLIRV